MNKYGYTDVKLHTLLRLSFFFFFIVPCLFQDPIQDTILGYPRYPRSSCFLRLLLTGKFFHSFLFFDFLTLLKRICWVFYRMSLNLNLTAIFLMVKLIL